jgi:AbrB family looped-hinge helix DNA binding protein
MSTEVTPIQSTSAKGQVTIPIAIRRKLGIEEGTKIRFVERDGQVVLEKVDLSLASLCGMFTAAQHASLEDMDRAVGDAMAEKFARKNANR